MSLSDQDLPKPDALWTHGDPVVGVMALGYVGLPLALTLCEAGLRVTGYDPDPEKIEVMRGGGSPLRHIDAERVRAAVATGRFRATGEASDLEGADAILICVPTPLGAHREPDLSHVREAAAAAAKRLKQGGLLVLESTTYPGTTRDLIGGILKEQGRDPERDCLLAYSPEREDPGRTDHTLRGVPKLVGGTTDAATSAAAGLYGRAFENVIPVSSAEVAESAKLLENIYRAVNIALVNEMKVVLEEIGVDVWEVVEAAATKPFGFQPFYPGPGLGGHCIPVDPFYMAWRAKEAGQPTRFIELAGEINRAMPRYVVERVLLALNRSGLAVRGAKILVLGLAYKPNVDDVRESPSYELIQRLRSLGAEVSYHDPYLAEAPRVNGLAESMRSVAWSEQVVADADAVLIACHHDWYDWAWLGRVARLIIDTRGVMRRQANSVACVVEA
ncbi:nucleotide sugar dehydrogenase [Mucisphaera calidilacus]|uniref:UDP-N-acetyl-D-glucosamine 6-dehydrogenase n=1 Tax=Mucisphaera calidilacus TaxID=2527982 RepID=A0A518BZY2_9BACT|nr:nucleotide sugar dehydrogenase [Mucisphaera calidilacus]QDU72532.1 UDP-N-acetyl-D-glucosamine 6-dehydrogenase [Mucisphaera calidilacus]